MKIVKDGLYMYNDGEELFIVKANGVIDKYLPHFQGTVVFSQGKFFNVGEFSEFDINEVKRIDNKITYKDF